MEITKELLSQGPQPPKIPNHSDKKRSLKDYDELVESIEKRIGAVKLPEEPK